MPISCCTEYTTKQVTCLSQGRRGGGTQVECPHCYYLKSVNLTVGESCQLLLMKSYLLYMDKMPLRIDRWWCKDICHSNVVILYHIVSKQITMLWWEFLFQQACIWFKFGSSGKTIASRYGGREGNYTFIPMQKMHCKRILYITQVIIMCRQITYM